ncbi:MAG: bifunctional 5,10-methylenetetrahydrofolate dehydrogenase/5,10-methenyltetrahydrofolate cyclohydrolase [FCB group bacterium]|nr:bifunctional 5,10-methylenetetrahydrofolate dehydrogenase/5,10-methenyltetrahydrofolate cyclohydrolase [FCB group bacterium]
MPQTKILSGKEVSQSVYHSLKPRIKRLKERGIIPGLAVVLVGEDPASKIYVRSKTRRFRDMELYSETFTYPASITESELIDKIQDLNRNELFHGILVQLPLPKIIDTDKVIGTVDPDKDVDGFHPENLGRLTAGKPRFIPCTPKGIMRILEYYQIDLNGKHVVVIGRSNIVGRPISILTSLKRKNSNATTTICHSGTRDIPYYTRQADVVIAAIGVPNFVDDSYLKPGAIVIDVGINRVADQSEKGYHLTGDVDQEKVTGIAAALTPVPGGVGPMTIAMLVENTVESAEYSVSDI